MPLPFAKGRGLGKGESKTEIKQRNKKGHMGKLFEKFAEICKKYELKKSRGTLQLFVCFLQVFDRINYRQYEKNTFSRLEAAKLIRLLKDSSKILVKDLSGGVSVEVSNKDLLAELYMHLNTELEKESCGLYSSALKLATEKKPIAEGSEYAGVVFATSEYTEPYTDQELDAIIAFEAEEAQKELAMGGYTDLANGKKKDLPKIGYFAQKFLIEATELFGDFYCSDGLDEDGNPLKPAMPITDQNNLIGDLLELSGVLECYKGKKWVDNEWAVMDRAERYTEVKNWIKSCERAQKPFAQSKVLSSIESQFVPPKVREVSPVERELEFIRRTGFDHQQVLAFFKQMDF